MELQILCNFAHFALKIVCTSKVWLFKPDSFLLEMFLTVRMLYTFLTRKKINYRSYIKYILKIPTFALMCVCVVLSSGQCVAV